MMMGLMALIGMAVMGLPFPWSRARWEALAGLLNSINTSNSWHDEHGGRFVPNQTVISGNLRHLESAFLV